MYRVMIVDDEPIIRKGLKSFIKWEELECEVVYEAVDGIDARDNLDNSRPDIVIADIKMPELNGLELAQYIRENHPLIKVIILTGYSDFYFAQSAIKYDVVDFVLKPTSTEKILEGLSKAKELLKQQNEDRLKFQALESKVNYSIAELREKLINDIINEVITDPYTLEMKIKELDIGLENYIMLLYEIDTYKVTEDNATAGDQNKLTLTLKNLLPLAFKNYRHYNTFIGSRLICSIISFEQDAYCGCIKELLPVCEEILEMVENFINIKISIGISSMHNRLPDMPKAYDEALKALSDKFYNGNSIFIYQKSFDRELSAGAPGLNHNIDIDHIIGFIHSGNQADAIDAMNKFLEKQSTYKQPIGIIKNLCILICSLCYKLMMNYSIYVEMSASDIPDDIYRQIFESISINQLSEILAKVIKFTVLQLEKDRKLDNYIISKVKNYMQDNYSSNINLQSIANHVHVNSSYLSRLFHQKTGETITKTLTGIRIEKAAELLKNPEIKSYEVAARVGFDDPSYFAQAFKKHTGLSPKEYKHTYAPR